MRQQNILYGIFILGLTITLIAYIAFKISSPENPFPATWSNDSIPTFTLANLDDPKQSMTQLDLRKGPSLLIFWASWCAACQAEMPMLLKIQKDYPNLKSLSRD